MNKVKSWKSQIIIVGIVAAIIAVCAAVLPHSLSNAETANNAANADATNSTITVSPEVVDKGGTVTNVNITVTNLPNGAAKYIMFVHDSLNRSKYTSEITQITTSQISTFVPATSVVTWPGDEYKITFYINDVNGNTLDRPTKTFTVKEPAIVDTNVKCVSKNSHATVVEGGNVQVLDENGNVFKEWVGGQDAELVTGLTAGQTYTITVTKAPDGYEIPEVTSFKLNEDGTINDETTTPHDSPTGPLLVEFTKNIPPWFDELIEKANKDVDGLAQTGDSKAVQDIFTNAKKDLDNYEYDDTKTQAQVAAEINAIVEAAKTAATNQRVTDFAEYKAEIIAAINGSLQEGDSTKVQTMINDFGGKINALEYDHEKTPAVNNGRVDQLNTEFVEALMNERTANFEKAKENSLTAIDGLNDEGQSADETKAIDQVKEEVNNVSYDATKTPKQNQDAVFGPVTNLQNQLASMRAAEYNKAKATARDTINQMGQSGDSGKVHDIIEGAIIELDAMIYHKEQNLTYNKKIMSDLVDKTQASVDDQRAVDNVFNLINALPNPATTADKAQVAAARAAYEALTAEQKARITVLNKLETAEKQVADHEAADKVIAMIKALPHPITVNDEAAVNAAKAAFDALTDDQKALVGEENVKALEQAEKDLADAKAKQQEEQKKAADEAAANANANAQTGDVSAIALVGLVLLALLSGAVVVSRKKVLG